MLLSKIPIGGGGYYPIKTFGSFAVAAILTICAILGSTFLMLDRSVRAARPVGSAVLPGVEFTSITTGEGNNRAFAFDTHGRLWGWGVNRNNTGDSMGGMIGIGSTFQHVNTPQLIGSDFKTVSAGRAWGQGPTYALSHDGRLFGWGYDLMNLQNHTMTMRNASPVLIGGIGEKRFSQIALEGSGNAFHQGLIALCTENRLFRITADDGIVRLGIDLADVPDRFKSIYAGISNFFAICEDDRLWAWGQGHGGRLGVGSVNSISELTPVAGDLRWKTVAPSDSSGAGTTFGITLDGNLYMWGTSLSAGGFSTNLLYPTRVETDYKFTNVAVGSGHVLAIKEDGRLFSMGNNHSGQLGTGDILARTELTHIATNLRFSYVAAVASHSFAISTCGNTFSWGAGGSTLGQGSMNWTFRREVPVMIAESERSIFHRSTEDLRRQLEEALRQLEEHRNALYEHDNRITTVEGWQNRLDQIENDIAGMRSSLSSLETDLVRLEAERNSMAFDILTAQNNITSLQNDVTRITGEVNQMNSQIFNLENDVSGINATLANTINNIITERIGAYSGDLNFELYASRQQVMNTIQTEISRIDGLINQLEQAGVSNQHINNLADARISHWLSQFYLHTANDRLVTLQANFNQLDTRVTNQNTAISVIETQIIVLDHSRTYVMSRINAFTETSRLLQNQIDALQREIDRITNTQDNQTNPYLLIAITLFVIGGLSVVGFVGFKFYKKRKM